MFPIRFIKLNHFYERLSYHYIHIRNCFNNAFLSARNGMEAREDESLAPTSDNKMEDEIMENAGIEIIGVTEIVKIARKYVNFITLEEREILKRFIYTPWDREGVKEILSEEEFRLLEQAEDMYIERDHMSKDRKKEST
jgi:hypothetical protein